MKGASAYASKFEDLFDASLCGRRLFRGLREVGVVREENLLRQAALYGFHEFVNDGTLNQSHASHRGLVLQNGAS